MSRPGQTYEPILAAWSLSSIISDVCRRAGVPLEFVNVDIIEGSVDGFSATCKHSAASAIQSLAAIYMFDPANTNGNLSFIPRGEDPIVSITRDDLIDDGSETESVNRSDSITVSKVMNLNYYDTEGGLNLDMQTSDRSLDSRATATSTSETSIIMRADDAAKAVAISHKVAIEEQRGEFEIKLPIEYIYLSESDVILFEGQRLRITDKDLDDGFQSYKVSFDRKSAYDSQLIGLPIDPPSEAPSLVADETVFEFIDSHIISSADDSLGYYFAVASLGTNWPGAVVEMSKDGGATWIASEDASSNSVMGKLVSTLPVHSRYYPDEFNYFDVEFLRDDMEVVHATLGEMQNRANLAAVGDELINFSEVEQLDEKTWRIGYLLRGRKGSPIVSHPVGTRFVVMDQYGVEFVESEPFNLGKQLTFRAVTYGLTDGEQKTVTFTGQSQRERAVAYLAARRNGSNLRVTWQGVGKIGGGAAVGMGLYFNGYKVTHNGTSQITRDEFVDLTYASGTVSVSQLNTITGEGPVTTINV